MGAAISSFFSTQKGSADPDQPMGNGNTGMLYRKSRGSKRIQWYGRQMSYVQLVHSYVFIIVNMAGKYFV